MKRFLLLFGALLLPFACDDDTPRHKENDGGVVQVPGVCELSKCPKPATGKPCCTPDAQCGSDSTGIGLTCDPIDEAASSRKCVLKDCPTPLIGAACCTPRAQCGWDPFASGLLCLANAQINLPADAGAPPQLCDLASCPAPDGGPKPCCQLNSECGVDTLGTGLCFPPPTCDLSHCPMAVEGGPAACCQANSECGVDVFGIGLCFPRPVPLCDLASCPSPDGGAKACCLANAQCGVDLAGNGFCSAPPPAPKCDLSLCPHRDDGLRTCCLPNADCGVDLFSIGLCFAPPPPVTDAGAGTPPVTTPPDDPSITGECPSFLGLTGPVWGCCSAYGVCGMFGANQCLLALGTQLPVGPPPPKDAGVTEPFLRCTPPAATK